MGAGTCFVKSLIVWIVVAYFYLHHSKLIDVFIGKVSHSNLLTCHSKLIMMLLQISFSGWLTCQFNNDQDASWFSNFLLQSLFLWKCSIQRWLTCHSTWLWCVVIFTFLFCLKSYHAVGWRVNSKLIKMRRNCSVWKFPFSWLKCHSKMNAFSCATCSSPLVGR